MYIHRLGLLVMVVHYIYVLEVTEKKGKKNATSKRKQVTYHCY